MAAKKNNTLAKKTGVSAALYTVAGTQSGEVALPESVFGQKPNAKLIAQAVRVYLARQRQASAHTKTRGDIKISTRKIYKQKGTGGARHGARSAPIFVGGGVTHGPKNFENYDLEIPKKLARKAFVYALSDKAQSELVGVAKGLEKVEPKTKNISAFLKKAKIRKTTIVHSGSENLVRAGRNIKGISLIRAQELNTYDVVTAKMLLLTQEGLELLTKRGETKNA